MRHRCMLTWLASARRLVPSHAAMRTESSAFRIDTERCAMNAQCLLVIHHGRNWHAEPAMLTHSCTANLPAMWRLLASGSRPEHKKSWRSRGLKSSTEAGMPMRPTPVPFDERCWAEDVRGNLAAALAARWNLRWISLRHRWSWSARLAAHRKADATRAFI